MHCNESGVITFYPECPHDFSALPVDVWLLIIRSVGIVDLLALGCTNKQMRWIAGSSSPEWARRWDEFHRHNDCKRREERACLSMKDICIAVPRWIDAYRTPRTRVLMLHAWAWNRLRNYRTMQRVAVKLSRAAGLKPQRLLGKPRRLSLADWQGATEPPLPGNYYPEHMSLGGWSPLLNRFRPHEGRVPLTLIPVFYGPQLRFFG